MNEPDTTTSFEVSAVPPFDLALTVAALRRRPTNLVERFEDGEYYRLLPLPSGIRYVGVRQVAADTLQVRALDGPASAPERQAVASILDHVLGLSIDLTALTERLAADERLGRLAEGLSGLKPPCFPDLWTTLLNVIPYQQVSLDAGMAVANRLTTQLGDTREVAGRRAYLYPTAERVLATPLEVIRACGFSAAKTRTLRGVAQAACDGLLDNADYALLDDSVAQARLESLPGIGPWSAQLVLLRGLRRLSVFPPGDSGAARNVRIFLGVDETAAHTALDELGAILGPYRGMLYFFLLGQRLRALGQLPGR